MNLHLYLVRHAIAEEATEGMRDSDRRLTEEGIRRMLRAARGLRRIGVAPDRVVSSPLRRAAETAALVARVLAPGLEVEIEPSLAPGCEPAEVVRWLAAARPQSAIALVGHEPGMSRLASFLLTGSSEAAPLRFKKGAVAALHLRAERAPGGAELEWLLTPRQLRAMGGRDR
jgi:phosphohistidine phosphatase